MKRLLLLLVIACVGCNAGEPLRIGAKSFDEQRVLAQMLASLVTSELGEPCRIVDCGDTYGCESALRDGAIDVLVEYSGTALALNGAPPGAETDELWQSMDARRVADLGFDNGYALVVSTATAEQAGLQTISDLAVDGVPVRVAAPSTYLGRPRDGLPSLLRRYGLEQSGRTLVIDEPPARYRALAQGRADVAIGYETDPALDEPSLRVLDDDLGFFPPYRAEVVARTDALARFEGLEAQLARLDDTLDAPTMRTLVGQVQHEGRAPEDVARRFLLDEEIADVSVSEGGGAELPIAVHPADALDDARGRAVSVARRSFPDRPTPLRETRDVGGTLASGEARLAVLGAERFFVWDGSGPPRRDDRLSATAVLGTRVLHELRRTDGDRIGAPPQGSGAAMLAEAVLDAPPAVRGDAETLVARLADGTIDAAILVEALPSPAIAGAMRTDPTLRLIAIEPPGGPVLRPVRIPVGTYPEQREPVPTVGAQVLLAAPAPSTTADAVVGPAAALRIGGHPLSAAEVSRLHDALGEAELPDPALPSPWNASTRATPPSTVGQQVFDTVANLFTLLFLAWLAWLMFRRPVRA